MVARRQLTPMERAFAKGAVQAAKLSGNKKLPLSKVAILIYHEFGRAGKPSEASISRAVRGKSFKSFKRGAKAKLSGPDKVRLVVILDKLQDKEDGEVTAKMVLHKAGFADKVTAGHVSYVLRQKGRKWRSPKHKLELSDADRADSLTFAKKYSKKRKSVPDLIIREMG